MWQSGKVAKKRVFGYNASILILIYHLTNLSLSTTPLKKKPSYKEKKKTTQILFIHRVLTLLLLSCPLDYVIHCCSLSTFPYVNAMLSLPRNHVLDPPKMSREHAGMVISSTHTHANPAPRKLEQLKKTINSKHTHTLMSTMKRAKIQTNPSHNSHPSPP